jgi:predicted RNA-binding Zn-ribbon protein involved in translation (DUF1610 family)
MTTILRDLMLICRNGHVITDRLRARPDLNMRRCDRCGAATIDRCDTCGHLIGGANPVPFQPVATGHAPSVCTTCGATFPWAKGNDHSDDELLGRLENLLRRLPLVARELGRRERSPLVIRDDRDLDDLVRALLPVLFEVVRVESCTPAYSLHTRKAFWLPAVQAMVFAQLAGATDGEAELERRRIEDLEYCRTRSNCATLIWFVLDPATQLRDTERLETVWSDPERRPAVRCVIA